MGKHAPALKSHTNNPPTGFSRPTALPESGEQAKDWQEHNRSWWENHPMRYDWKEAVASNEFSVDFFEEIDQRFFSNSAVFMPWQHIPFDPLIDFKALADKDVLEIGVGCGSHAGLLARHAHQFFGIDLTNQAVQYTTARMHCFDLNGTIRQMDAEQLAFDDNSFDFIWSWGVIHHSANTRQILSEMRRVLRPGGTAITMVYHRSFWNFYILAGLFHGILRGELFRNRSLHTIQQGITDGAIARYYSISEWNELVSEFFQVENIRIFGSKAEIIPLPGGRVKSQIMNLVPDSLSRYLTNDCKMGSFLVSTLRKEE